MLAGLTRGGGAPPQAVTAKKRALLGRTQESYPGRRLSSIGRPNCADRSAWAAAARQPGSDLLRECFR